MLTPAFEIHQDNTFITIVIKAQFAKISETEIHVDDCEFKFYSSPYYLRLNLPGAILEDGRETAKFDSDKGTFTIILPKVNEGEHFEGLDMLTRLLAPSGANCAKQPIIEVLDGSGGGCHGDAEDQDEEEEEFDWQIEQQVYREDVSLGTGRVKYGFANQRSGVFQRLQSELCELIDLKDADNVPPSQRRELRLAEEEDKFDDDHYLADLYEDELVNEALHYKPLWDEQYRKLKAGAKIDSLVELSDEEKEKMRKLPRKEYLLDDDAQRNVLLGLVDILFAYAYNHRTTDGENTVESAWTLCKLSATLSWLETYSNLKDVVVTSYRRCLCYPLYRHWKLTRRVLRDVRKILALGRSSVVKCLLETHSLLNDTDCHYILNDLYITDYCVWVQSVSAKQLESVAEALMNTHIEKGDVGLGLETLEVAASIAVEEDQLDSDDDVDEKSATDSLMDKLQGLSVSKQEGGVSRNPETASESGSKEEVLDSNGEIGENFKTVLSEACTQSQEYESLSNQHQICENLEMLTVSENGVRTCSQNGESTSENGTNRTCVKNPEEVENIMIGEVDRGMHCKKPCIEVLDSSDNVANT